MRRQALIMLLLAMLATGIVVGRTPSVVEAAPPAAWQPYVYFPETGHNVGLRIKDFYDAHGGLKIFGLPLTELFDENGQLVQYFERAKFEIHPENPEQYYVQLKLLGRFFTENRMAEPPFAWGAAVPCNDPSLCWYFQETTHNLGAGFREFWRNNGGLEAFGYPISEEFSEVSATDGQTYTVQYFERARFEYHPEHAGTPHEIQLGLLGAEYANVTGLAAEHRAPARAMVQLGAATTGFGGSSSERAFNIARAAAKFNGLIVRPGETFSFLKNVGDVSEDAGYVDGYAIVNGRLEKVVGGGLCQVSTTFYRAVFWAGMPIVERRPHSYVVYFYENIDGFDAAVFTPNLDFRWRNEMSTPIYIYTETNVKAGQVTFSLWGHSDGRKTTMVGPERSNVRQPGKAIWQHDPNLKRGQVLQLVHGRAGMDVSMERHVRGANGAMLRRDVIKSHYEPWADFFAYGPGVNPPAGVIVVAPKS